MKTIRISHLFLSAFALVLSGEAVRAEAGSQPQARLGEPPAVLVARRGVQPDPTANFYLHPARLEWGLERPLAEGEHPAVLIARRGVQPDPTAHFYLMPPP